jgi:serine/threonine-protein kinase
MLTDFGLAKDVESGSKMTRSGMTLGTPHYMPPEQAKGELSRVDERSDVYSLGATFYEMLALQPPFSGSNVMEIMHKVLFKEPVSPRRGNPAIDTDLETICLKCLEKAPDRRYPKAAALARDLANYLDGAPIAARPASFRYRIRKKAGRHKALVATATISLLLLVAAGIVGAFVLSRMKGESEREVAKAEADADKQKDRADEADRLREKNLKVAEVLLGAFVNLGEIQKELKLSFYDLAKGDEEKQAFYRTHEKDIEAFCESLIGRPMGREFFAGDWPPPGIDHATLATVLAVKGWLLRFGCFGEGSLACFELAYETDPDVAWGNLFHAIVHLSHLLLLQPTPRALFSGSRLGFEKVPEESASMRKEREEFEKHAKEALRARAWGKEAKDLREVTEGFLEIGGGDEGAVEKAFSKALSLPELKWVEEELFFVRAKTRYLNRDFEGGLEDINVLLKRKYEAPEFFELKALLLLASALKDAWEGREPWRKFRDAASTFTEIQKRYPKGPASYINCGNTYLSLADAQARRGLDPRESYRRAIQEFRKGAERDPEEANAYNNCGNAYAHLGKAEALRGIDPRPSYRKAVAEFDEALERNPEHIVALCNRGLVYNSFGDAEAARNEDPRPSFRKAIADFDEALKRNPEYVDGYCYRGGTRVSQAEAELPRGGDAGALIRRALEDFGEALKRNPGCFRVYVNRATAYLTLGQWEVSRGLDPRESYRKAIRDSSEALKGGPELSEPFQNRAQAHKYTGEAEAARGMDPRPSYRKAIVEYGEALKRNPENFRAYIQRAAVFDLLGRFEASRGSDPRTAFGEAIADFDKALKINPESMVAIINRAIAFLRLGEGEIALGLDPRKSYGEALAGFQEALKKNPDLALAYYNRGRTYMAFAKAESSLGLDSRDTYRKALREFDEALKRNTKHAGSYVDRGITTIYLGDAATARGRDPHEFFQKALRDLTEALKLDPRDWRALSNQGIMLEKLGRYEEAVAVLESALKAKGDIPLVQRRLARARMLCGAPPWSKTLAKADSYLRDGNYQAALPLFEKGFAEGEKAGAYGEEKHWKILNGNHINLACAYTFFSVGMKSRLGDPVPPPPEEAAALRVKAVASLRKAVDLGLTDLGIVRDNTFFIPLRDMPEFKALVAEMEKRSREGK